MSIITWFPLIDTLFYMWQHTNTLSCFVFTRTPQDRHNSLHFTGDKTEIEMSLAQDQTFSRVKTITPVFLESFCYPIVYVFLMFFSQNKPGNYCNVEISLVHSKNFSTLSKFH